jgi:hypothetical protein
MIWRILSNRRSGQLAVPAWGYAPFSSEGGSFEVALSAQHCGRPFAADTTGTANDPMTLSDESIAVICNSQEVRSQELGKDPSLVSRL